MCPICCTLSNRRQPPAACFYFGRATALHSNPPCGQWHVASSSYVQRIDAAPSAFTITPANLQVSHWGLGPAGVPGNCGEVREATGQMGTYTFAMLAGCGPSGYGRGCGRHRRAHDPLRAGRVATRERSGCRTRSRCVLRLSGRSCSRNHTPPSGLQAAGTCPARRHGLRCGGAVGMGDNRHRPHTAVAPLWEPRAN